MAVSDREFSCLPVRLRVQARVRFHLAAFNDINKLCVELGHNNPALTFQRYANGITAHGAREFWLSGRKALDAGKALKDL